MSSKHPFGWDLPPGVNASDIPGNRPEDEAWDRMMDTFYQETHFTKDEQKFVDEQPVVEIITKAIEYGIKVGTHQQMDCEKEASHYMFQHLKDYMDRKIESMRQDIHRCLDNVEQGKEGDAP